MAPPEELVKRTARVLSGFMSAGPANAFAKGCHVLDPADFLSRWRAQVSVSRLHSSYTAPRIEPVPTTAVAHVKALFANPRFAADYPNAEIKMIELGKITACQWWVDADAADGVHGRGLDGQPSLDDVLALCLPLTIHSPLRAFFQRIGPNDMRVYSMDNTLRVEGPSDPDERGRCTVVIGTAPNLMLVREHKDRYVLFNGYHRALSLHRRGVQMVPVVVIPAAAEGDIGSRPDLVPTPVLCGDRPPTIGDFFDDSVSMNVNIRSTMRAIRISAESLTVPRLL